MKEESFQLHKNSDQNEVLFANSNEELENDLGRNDFVSELECRRTNQARLSTKCSSNRSFVERCLNPLTIQELNLLLGILGRDEGVMKKLVEM